MRKQLLLLAFLGFALPLLAKQTEAPKLDPDLPYQAKRSNPVTYEVDFSAVVTPPYHTKTLKVWLPIPQTDAGQEVTNSEVSAFPMNVTPKITTEPVFGNKFAYFEFDHPEGAQIVRHKFTIKIWELRWDVDPAKVASVTQWPSGFNCYLRGEEQAVVVNDKVKETVKQIVPEKRGPARDLASVMNWINAQMKYDHDHASLQASSEHAINNRTGHCSDYHGLCSALGRALGYPTRITYGINTFPKNSPVALQDGSVSAAVWLGQLRCLRAPETHRRHQEGQEPGRCPERQASKSGRRPADARLPG
jgi:transglutaminase-like putative cysteine protease